MRIRGRRIVVTGASSGIGRSAAARLASAGANVWAVARSTRALNELAATQSGIEPFTADLTDPDARAALAAATGPIDVLVNNAGAGWLGLVEQMPFDQVRHLYELNVLAGIDLTLKYLPGMLDRRCGRVVNVSSASAWSAFPPLSVYASTKWAVQGFTTGLNREIAWRGVSAVTVNPGPTATRFAVASRADNRPVAELPDETMPGIPVAWVTRAIVKAIRYGALPGYQTIAVPRLFAFARLDTLPITQWPMDLAAIVARQRPRRQPVSEPPIGERRDLQPRVDESRMSSS